MSESTGSIKNTISINFQQYGKWIIFIATFIFFYSISSFFHNASLFHTLLNTDSINSYLFYSWKEPFFLDFNFHGIHPYYLFLSFFGKFLTTKTLIGLIFADFCLLFFFISKFKIINFQLTILWIISGLFIFKYNANGLFLWFQFCLYLIFIKKVKPGNPPMWATVSFYIVLSFIFLPGMILIFIYNILTIFVQSRDLKLHKHDFLNQINPFAISTGILLILHLAIAYSWYGVPGYQLFHYLSLPFTMTSTKYITNNVPFFEALFINLDINFNIYIILLCIMLIWLFIFRDKFIAAKGIAIGILLTLGFVVTRAESVIFPLAGFFLLYDGHSPKVLTFNKKMAALILTLIIFSLALLRSIRIPELMIDAGHENIVVSFVDLQKINFNQINTGGSQPLKNLIIIDLKIIPENVMRLITEIKSGKIDILLNNHAIRYLEKELDYEKKVIDRFTKDNYTIYIKSSIHPDQEKWPFRRVYTLWQIIKKNNPDARIILF